MHAGHATMDGRLTDDDNNNNIDCSFFNDIHISFNMPNGKRYYHKLTY